MTFHDLAKYFSEIEATTSRLKITEILSRLFKSATPTEIGPICYLLQGRVVPLYDNCEFGVADKFMIRAIAQAYGVEQSVILNEFKTHGDLGITAQSCYHVLKHSNMNQHSVIEVFTALFYITQLSGVGSQEKKITALSEILQKLDGLSARYLVRIPLDKLRLGFSDMTILDGLSWMLTRDKSLRDQLEAAYNVCPDIGYIAKTVKDHGIKGLSKVQVKLGTPILASLCQRLPTAEEMIKKMHEVAVEPKYDGVRCIGGYTGLFVRGRGYISARNIQKGDFVLTHMGRFKRVLAVTRRYPHRGEKMYRLQTMLGDSCVISGDHPVLREKQGKTDWTPVSKLASDDWLVFPKVKYTYQKSETRLMLEDAAGYRKSIALNENFFRFLGFWVGDGFSNNSHQSERVGITFNAKTEASLAEEYEKIIRGELQIQEISKNERNGGLNIYWRDSLFRKWLIKEFRYQESNGEHGKNIPDWMFGITRRHFLAFIKGWSEADGTIRHANGTRITTKEHKLANMAVLMGFTFQHPIGVRKVRIILEDNLPKTYYELYIPGTKRYVKELSDMYIVKIHTLKEIKTDPRAYLYDFQVEEDESFCISLGSLHNCQIHVSQKEVETFSRNLENTTDMFPELENIHKQIKVQSVILDSEAVGIDPVTGKLVPFQKTTTRKRKHDIQSTLLKVPLKFYVFDILYKDGKDLLSLPLYTRRAILEKTLKPGSLLVLSPQIITSSAAKLLAYHDQQLKNGLEGVVIKKWNSPYEPGRRGYSWVKYKEEEGQTGKLTDTIDAVVMGYTRGEGKRSKFGIGQFLVGVKKGDEFVTLTKIGTGVSDDLWHELKKTLTRLEVKNQPKQYSLVVKALIPDVWVTPQLVVEIAGDDLTVSPSHGAGYAVRFPRLVRIRHDKSPAQVTSAAEVTRMYKDQLSLNSH